MHLQLVSFYATKCSEKKEKNRIGGIGVAKGGAQASPQLKSTKDKKLWQHSPAMFSCSFFQ